MGKLRKLYTYFWITNKFIKGWQQFFIFYLYLSLEKAVFQEVTHGLFTFNAAPIILFYTTLLLGHSCNGAPFCDVFSISVALSLGAILRLINITPGGNEARVVGRNTRRKRDNKKNFKNHIIGSIITSKDFLSVKICNYKINKKIFKTSFYGQVQA